MSRAGQLNQDCIQQCGNRAGGLGRKITYPHIVRCSTEHPKEHAGSRLVGIRQPACRNQLMCGPGLSNRIQRLGGHRFVEVKIDTASIGRLNNISRSARAPCRKRHSGWPGEHKSGNRACSLIRACKQRADGAENVGRGAAICADEARSAIRAARNAWAVAEPHQPKRRNAHRPIGDGPAMSIAAQCHKAHRLKPERIGRRRRHEFPHGLRETVWAHAPERRIARRKLTDTSGVAGKHIHLPSDAGSPCNLGTGRCGMHAAQPPNPSRRPPAAKRAGLNRKPANVAPRHMDEASR